MYVTAGEFMFRKGVMDLFYVHIASRVLIRGSKDFFMHMSKGMMKESVFPKVSLDF